MSKLPPTELPMKINKTIDKLDIYESINLMINDQQLAIQAISKQTKTLELIISNMYQKLIEFSDSRLIYCGAGTSGRIAVQDGVELYPTFGWPKKRFKFILAGGDKALTASIENSEDGKETAIKYLDNYKISNKDIVIGLAASGNTPFTCQLLSEATARNALTIALTNNPHGDVIKHSNHHIILDTGQEVITGSTRLKAGTSQKICLNIISSILMTKLGFVKDGLMINLVPANEKLRKRKMIIKNYFKNKKK